MVLLLPQLVIKHKSCIISHDTSQHHYNAEEPVLELEIYACAASHFSVLMKHKSKTKSPALLFNMTQVSSIIDYISHTAIVWQTKIGTHYVCIHKHLILYCFL